MRALERAVEWLRPLVDSKAWDYCVVWKLGDEPSRFIEWLGCCCSGGDGVDSKTHIKEERREQPLATICRDIYSQHPIRTKACEALAHFPSSMALYSGVHGEVVISNTPRWITHDNSDSDPSHHHLNGTQVLIPVFGGLIELFTAKNIPHDQKIIGLVMAHYNVSLDLTMQSFTNEHHLDSSHTEYLENWQPAFQFLSLLPGAQFLPPVTQSSTYPSFEGSSHEHPSLDSNSGCISQDGSLKQPMGESFGCKRSPNSETLLKQEPGLLSGNASRTKKDKARLSQRADRESFQSKNLFTERNRRNRIRDGLYALRALVPKITKMDKAATLGDAIDYIEELQNEVKKLEDELKEMEENDSKRMPKLDAVHGEFGHYFATSQNQSSNTTSERKLMEEQVEVIQIGKRDFLIKSLCEQKQGGFTRLMEAMNSLGLQVVDANVTTFDGMVLNILRVEAKKEIQAKKLRESLMELTERTEQTVFIRQKASKMF